MASKAERDAAIEKASEQVAGGSGFTRRKADEHLAERLEVTEPLTDEEIRACLSAISDNDWAYYIADQGAEFLDALKAKLRARLAREDAPDGV